MSPENRQILSPEREPPISVSMVFISRLIGAAALENIYILLTERLQDPEKGKFTLPGGKIKPGESPREAATRELLEETSLVITPWQLREGYKGKAWVGGKEIMVHFFSSPLSECFGNPQRVEEDKHSDWEWFLFSELFDLAHEDRLHSVVANQFHLPSHIFEGCLIIKLGQDLVFRKQDSRSAIIPPDHAKV